MDMCCFVLFCFSVSAITNQIAMSFMYISVWMFVFISHTYMWNVWVMQQEYV